MNVLRNLNLNFFNGVMPNINSIKNELLKEHRINMPFIHPNFHVERGSMNLFCGHRGRGFGLFLNTLANDVVVPQNLKTTLISDIILKAYMQESLRKAEYAESRNLFSIKDDFSIKNNTEFEQKLNACVKTQKPDILLVYPFLMPEEQFEGVFNTLKTIAEKEELIVIFNIPLEEYLKDQRTLSHNPCEIEFFDRLNVDHVIKLNGRSFRQRLNAGQELKLEVTNWKTGASYQSDVVVDEGKQTLLATTTNEVA